MPSTFTPPDGLADTEPDFDPPTGKIWRRRASAILEREGDDERTYLVRRLESARSMLSVAPLLEQVTRFDHPRLWGPSFWTRHDDALWIATPEPRGVRLLEADLERLSFQEAVELWRPLAEAVARLHRAGLVHAQITPWNTWVDTESWRLTAIDAGCWVGDDLTALDDGDALWVAPELYAGAELRDPSPAADVYGLARLFSQLTLPGDAARAERPNFQGLPGYVIPTLDNALDEAPGVRPGRVSQLIGAMSPRTAERSADNGRAGSDDLVSAMHARVGDIETFEHPERGPGIKFVLYPRTVGTDQGAHRAFFYRDQAPEVFEGVRHVWEGCELNLLDARVVENSSGERFLTAHSTTLPILEPHMPLSVSAVLSSQGCPSRFLVDQRDRGESSRPLVFGNLVHGLLDDLVEPHPPDFETAFLARMNKLRVDLLAAGLHDGDLAEFQKDARRHYEHIRRFTERRTDEAPRHDRVGWSGRNVEVTRYSTRYGIEGRVDLVAEDDDEGLQIVELKSGKTWDGHVSQLRFYRFLWEGLAEARGLQVTGHLLYSRQGRMKETSMQDTERERRIMRARNELIACLRSFVEEDYTYEAPFYMQQPRLCRASACNFRRKRCQLQTEVLGLADEATPWTATEAGHFQGLEPALVARAWAWHEHFSRLIEMERWACTERLGAVLDPDRYQERLANYAASEPMRLKRANPESRYVEFVGPHRRIFTPGDYVVAHREEFERAHILRGRVVAVEGDHLTVSSPGAPVASTLSDDGWIIDKLPAKIGFRQAHHAIFGALKTGDEDRLEVLLRPDSERAARLARAPETSEPGGSTELNERQREAVHLGLENRHAALIQGPPGTGKTTVIAELVRRLVERGQRVLVSAFTNTAVDTMLARLLACGVDDFVRVGNSARSPELVRRLEARGKRASRHFSGDLGAMTDSLDELSETLLSRSVVASTTHRCVSSSATAFFRRELGDRPFDVAIVDEASQITEPMTLAAVNLADRFVLVGDHRQLPPIVENERAHSRFVGGFEAVGGDELESDETTSTLPEELRQMGCAGLDKSLFERLAEHLPRIVLEVQYRMHADIMAFSNRTFYDGRLRADASVRDHTLTPAAEQIDEPKPPLDEILSPDRPLVFVDVDHDGKARHNTREARALVASVEALIADAADPPSVGIVSPFRAQVHLIRRLLAESSAQLADEVDVDTVERFQGSERDAIFVSLVKTERAGDFLADERRLNVTLTRAKKKLVVFGSRACLELNPLYRALIEQPETHLATWTS